MPRMLTIPSLCLALALQDPQVEIRGVNVVEGISFKQGDKTKYSGDTYLVRFAFTDGKGQPWQPAPTMNFVVYNGQEPYKKVQRIMTKDQWKADAEKIGPKSVADNTMAFDKKSGELWIAVVRADSGFDFRFDLALEIKGTGTWSWKGLERDKDGVIKSAPKGPDKK
jgi:hypothetical protein